MSDYNALADQWNEDLKRVGYPKVLGLYEVMEREVDAEWRPASSFEEIFNGSLMARKKPDDVKFGYPISVFTLENPPHKSEIFWRAAPFDTIEDREAPGPFRARAVTSRFDPADDDHVGLLSMKQAHRTRESAWNMCQIVWTGLAD